MYFVEKSEKGDDSWDGSEMKEIDHFTHTWIHISEWSTTYLVLKYKLKVVK